MKTCEEVRPLLLAYELGAAEGGERDAVEAHVQGCPSCVAELLKLKRVREDAAAFDERPSPAVRDRLRRRVAARSPRRSLVWAAAAAALLLAAVWGLARVAQRPEPLPEVAPLVDSAPLSEDLL